MKRGIILAVLSILFIMPFIFAEIEIGTVASDQTKYVGTGRNCVAFGTEAIMCGKAGNIIYQCKYDSVTGYVTSISPQASHCNDFVTGVPSPTRIQCGYICFSSNVDKKITVGETESPSFNGCYSTFNVKKTLNIGANKNCIGIMSDVSRGGGDINVSCIYNKATGILNAEITGKTNFGYCDSSMHCNYLCYEDTLSSNTMESYTFNSAGTQNIGINKNFIGFPNRMVTPTLGYGTNCDYNYNPATGIALMGSEPDYYCSYLSSTCTTSSTCTAGQCGTSLSDGCSGTKNCPCSTGQICNSTTPGVLGTCISTECPSSQIIMKLSNSTNAHGALWNDSLYNYSVCYNQIFGEDYLGTSPHDCVGSNKVINLFSMANSHGEIPSLTNYNTPVCYGNLSCHGETSSGEECSDNREKVVMRLYSNTNSHISNASDTNYLVKICCKGSNAVVNGANWTNMKDEIINKADLKDSIKLIVIGQEIQNKNVNYTIYKEGAHWWNRDNVIIQTSTRGYQVWQAGLNSTGGYSPGNYYFIANVQGDPSPKTSETLVVSPIQNNSKPSIRIIKPIREKSFIINKTTGKTGLISFEQISSDEDDDLNVTWDFKDGESSTFSNCITTGNCNTTHSYTLSGTKMVKATAQEMLRSNNVSNLSRIYIYKKGLNIFAIIDSPPYNSTLGTIGTYLLNGSSSHVANCSFDFNECSAAASPKVCYNITDEITGETISCYKFAESSNPGFKFTWTIDGTVDNIHSSSAAFYYPFVTPIEHIINLKVNYTY